METWIVLVLGALVLVVVADLIRVATEQNIVSAPLWIASLFMAYKAWDMSPWRETHPTLSFVIVFGVYVLVSVVSKGIAWSRA